MKVGGPARYLFEPRNDGELVSLVDALRRDRIPFRILGGGTNVIAPDDGLPGAVVRLAGEFARLDFEGPLVTAGAAAALPRFVGECARKGLAGAEGLVGIPGTVGGALVMNSGGRWGTIGSIVDSVRVLDAEVAPRTLAAREIIFDYRHSSLKGSIVLSAVFRMNESDPQSVQAAAARILNAKRAAQDLAAASAGCIFKNPPGGTSAGALIDRAGLKGLRQGAAMVSDVHANFIVNTGGAAARDVLALAQLVKSRVLEAFDVDLEFEVELW